jgi:receptor-type tyrosine-protein phosphatase Q
MADSLTPGATGKAVAEEAVSKISNSGIFPSDNRFLIRVGYVESKFGTDPGTFRSGYYGGIWQVDQVGFLDTQNTKSHPGLVAKHKGIKDNFGIDWKTVTWKDLTKPFYSALAARLLLSNKPGAIPDTVAAQATYWKKYYNSDHPNAKGTEQKFKDDVKALEG